MTSAFPGAPGVPGGGDSGPTPPIKSGVVGSNSSGGGSEQVPVAQVFPGYDGQTWQSLAPNTDEVNESTMTDAGDVGGGVPSSSPAAFYPGLGQGV